MVEVRIATECSYNLYTLRDDNTFICSVYLLLGKLFVKAYFHSCDTIENAIF